jgi:diacylglycerol kinase family enzyme
MSRVLTAAFNTAGCDANIVFAHDGAGIAAAVSAAGKANPHVIVAGGGDGTISTVARAAIDLGIPLGVLPLGTLNHFAKDLKIPLALEAAVRVIHDGHTAAVDVGEVGGRIFLNNSSVGIYPRIVRHRDGQRRRYRRSKWLALMIATLTVLRFMPLFRFRIRLDGREEERRTSLILIGNNAYVMEGLHFGERKRIDAGQLSFYAPRHRGRTGLLRLALRALFGHLSDDAGFEIHSAREIVIDSEHRSLQVATDGEVNVMPTPLAYRIRPGALRVLVPATAVTS